MIVSIVAWLKEAAEKRFAAGDVHQGLLYYEKLLQAGRGETGAVADAHARIGEMLLGLGEVQQAKVHLLEAVKSRPTHPQYLFLLSCLYAVIANWKKAREFARKAHILAPDNSEYLRALGWAVLCSGDLGAGEKMLRQALSLDPGNVAAIGDVSAALIEQRRFTEAIELLSRAVREHPNDKRLADMLAVARKFREEVGERTLTFRTELSGKYGLVETLLRDRMPEEGFHTDQIDSAIRLWRDYAHRVQLKYSSPSAWAAAVEYAVSRVDGDDKVTQKHVAEKYGTSVSSVSTRFKRIWLTLGAKEFDTRYSSHNVRADRVFQDHDPTNR
jgi:tetratricopeptide (TPR) repeat protein